LPNGTTILALAGAAGVGFVLYQRWKAGQPTGAASPCAALGTIAGQYAAVTHPEEPQAGKVAQQAATLGCQAWSKLPTDKKIIAAVAGLPGLSFAYAKDGFDWAVSKAWGSRDLDADRRRNVELNGPVTAAVDPQMPGAFINRRAGGIFIPIRPGADGKRGLSVPLQHQNGCVPYSGHPGWAKCISGTRPNDNGPNRYTAAMGAATADDPTTGRHSDAYGSFPLPVPMGAAAYWERGVAKVCTAALTQDHRAGHAGFICGGPVYTTPTSGVGSATVGGVLVVPDTRGDIPGVEVP
jgi:hypothetical protein